MVWHSSYSYIFGLFNNHEINSFFTEKISENKSWFGRMIIIFALIIIVLTILNVLFAISMNALKQETIVC